MKKGTCHTIIFWTILLSFGFMLTGKAIACFVPDVMEMSQGKAMDCCKERCRMETTHEAAKKACDESRLAFSSQETLSNSQKDCGHSPLAMASDFNPLSLFSTPFFLETNTGLHRNPYVSLIFQYAATVPIYTTIQTFRI